MAAERTAEGEVDRLEAELRRVTISTLGLPPGLTADRWEQFTGDELKQIAVVLLSRIIVNPAAHGGVFNPERLVVSWADEEVAARTG